MEYCLCLILIKKIDISCFFCFNCVILVYHKIIYLITKGCAYVLTTCVTKGCARISLLSRDKWGVANVYILAVSSGWLGGSVGALFAVIPCSKPMASDDGDLHDEDVHVHVR